MMIMLLLTDLVFFWGNFEEFSNVELYFKYKLPPGDGSSPFWANFFEKYS